MSVWVWVLIGLGAAAGLFVYREIVWIPRHSALNDLEELPHLRTVVERLADSGSVTLVEEGWRWVLRVVPLRQPAEALPSDLDPPFPHPPSYSETGPDRDIEVARWEVTVNKKASEWIAEGFNPEGNRIVEHRFDPGSPRGNYWNHTSVEYAHIGAAMGRDITAWVQHLVAAHTTTDQP